MNDELFMPLDNPVRQLIIKIVISSDIVVSCRLFAADCDLLTTDNSQQE